VSYNHCDRNYENILQFVGDRIKNWKYLTVKNEHFKMSVMIFVSENWYRVMTDIFHKNSILCGKWYIVSGLKLSIVIASGNKVISISLNIQCD
jgi:hypothetical protein